MYLSRITLEMARLKPEMLEKWHSASTYAAHQWLWQLFPGCEQRPFLFRSEARGRFFVLSSVPPLATHTLFTVETKPFRPQLARGIRLDFQLRANPIICRSGKRNDVMMNAKYEAKQQGIAQEKWQDLQIFAACNWLTRQGENHGFAFEPAAVDEYAAWAGDDEYDVAPLLQYQPLRVSAWQQHQFRRRRQEKPLMYSSVDYTGTLKVTDVERFEYALFTGIGKSKALGCGMLMIKRSP